MTGLAKHWRLRVYGEVCTFVAHRELVNELNCEAGTVGVSVLRLATHTATLLMSAWDRRTYGRQLRC